MFGYHDYNDDDDEESIIIAGSSGTDNSDALTEPRDNYQSDEDDISYNHQNDYLLENESILTEQLISVQAELESLKKEAEEYKLRIAGYNSIINYQASTILAQSRVISTYKENNSSLDCFNKW